MAPGTIGMIAPRHLKAAALFGEPRLHAAAGFQPERRAAAEAQCAWI